MRIAFRADASPRIGAGHIMRCLALAAKLASRGAHISFIYAQLAEHLVALIQQRGYAMCLLNVSEESSDSSNLAHAAWLKSSQAEDAAACVALLRSDPVDWLVVDHYALDHRWETAVQSCARKLLVIDDLADRKHSCDLLLDQNLYLNSRERYAEKIPTKCVPLLGPAYALLREEFSEWRDRRAARSKLVRKVHVFFGGFDENDYTSRALRVIGDLRRTNISLDVVIGREHPNLKFIQDECFRAGHSCYIQISNMAELMASAELAIGATGSASWERCCLGLATIGVATAPNQQPIAAGLYEAGAIAWVRSPAHFEHGIALELERLLDNPRDIELMSAAAKKLVDGLGAERVTERLYTFS